MSWSLTSLFSTNTAISETSYELELDRRSVRLSSMLTRVGGHWELRTALLKAVWWGMRLASLLTHLLRKFIADKTQGGFAALCGVQMDVSSVSLERLYLLRREKHIKQSRSYYFNVSQNGIHDS